MKLLYSILLLFCVQTTVCAQNIVFADANFKNRLLIASPTGSNRFASSTWDNSNPLNPQVLNSVFVDTNHDGEIQVSEAQNITYLNLSGANINDLTGIEYFINLKGIDIYQNYGSGYGISTINATGLQNLEVLGISSQYITSYNFLSNFPNLKILGIDELIGNTTDFNWTNSIIRIQYSGYSGNINISHLPNLIYLDCRFNNLTSLDTSNNPNLQRVDCSLNHITTLDFRNNPQLNELACSGNDNLTSIYVKNGTTQLFDPNAVFPHFSYDDWSNCPNLNYICADANEIASIQSMLTPNYNIANITIDSACALGTEGFEKENVAVFPNPATHSFAVNTAVEKVAVYNLTGQLVQEFKGGFESGYNYDIQSLSAGVYLVKVVDDNNNEKNLKLVKE